MDLGCGRERVCGAGDVGMQGVWWLLGNIHVSSNQFYCNVPFTMFEYKLLIINFLLVS